MKTDTECKCCDPRCMAVALGRWSIGMMFFFAGVGKLGSVSGFVGYLTKQFEKTWLPGALLIPFGYVLPFAELILGALLLLGVFRNGALFVTGLVLLALTFGQLLLRDPQVMFFNTAYLFLTAGLLFLAEYDRWVLFPSRREEPAPPSE